MPFNFKQKKLTTAKFDRYWKLKSSDVGLQAYSE